MSSKYGISATRGLSCMVEGADCSVLQCWCAFCCVMTSVCRTHSITTNSAKLSCVLQTHAYIPTPLVQNSRNDQHGRDDGER